MEIGQSNFIQNLVIEKDLVDCNTKIVPIKAGFLINMTEGDDYEEKDLYIYEQSIGKLIYLSCDIRPSIAFPIGLFSRYNVDLKKDYLQVAKKVIKYRKETMNLDLIYGKKLASKISPPFWLNGYVNSNLIGNPKD